MKSFKDWSEKIKCEIQRDKDKKVILIAGASSSGKSFTSQKLCEYLNANGIKTCVFTADSYYKGISKIIVQKTLSKDKFKSFSKQEKEIIFAVRNIIEFIPFTEKFSIDNFKKVISNLTKICKKDATLLANGIKNEFEKINFDEPFAIDFVSLTNDLNKLMASKDIILPSYSFATGEPTISKSNILNGGYDIYIVEGLYVLRDELISNIDKSKIIPCAVECDVKSLLARRLNRDIKSGRTTFSPEQTIISTLAKTMPSYFENIFPFNKNSKYTLENSLTEDEINKKENSTQLKFFVNNSQLEKLEKLNLIKIYDKREIDYYFEDTKLSKNFIVRIREVDGLANKLTFKINKSNINVLDRKIEEYDLNEFSLENRYISNFLQNFVSSGFKLGRIITKTRQIYKYNNLSFKLDKVDNLGMFIEFDELNNDTKKIIKFLDLTKKCNIPYLNLIENKISKEFLKDDELINENNLY